MCAELHCSKGSLSPRLHIEKHFLTVDRVRKKSFLKVPGDLKYKTSEKTIMDICCLLVWCVFAPPC